MRLISSPPIAHTYNAANLPINTSKSLQDDRFAPSRGNQISRTNIEVVLGLTATPAKTSRHSPRDVEILTLKPFAASCIEHGLDPVVVSDDELFVDSQMRLDDLRRHAGSCGGKRDDVCLTRCKNWKEGSSNTSISFTTQTVRAQ